jgi:serine/threonine-protein kinase ATR
VDMNEKSTLWSALRQKVESLQLSLGCSLSSPVTKTLEGLAVILQLTALCIMHCSQENVAG